MAERQAVVYEHEGAISPFWQRMPWFFAFPFQADVLLILVPLSLAALLTQFAPVPEPFDFLLVQGLIWLAALRQAFGIMEAVSKGMLTSDERSTFNPEPERVNLPWKLLAIFLVWGLVMGVIASISKALYWLVFIFFNVCLPACVMALSMTNNVQESVNPGKWLEIMRGVGKPYLALLFFLVLLSEGAPQALPLLVPLLGSWLALPLWTFAMLYFNLIMFAMMGYTLYQFHQALGLAVKIEFSESASNPAAAADTHSDPMAEAIAKAVAEGDLESAVNMASEQQREHPEDMVVHERYHKLLLLAQKNDRALSHGQGYLALLLRKGRSDLGLNLLTRLRGLDERFRPARAEQVLPLAEAAFRRRDTDTILALVRGFDKSNPGHADIPGIYLLSARLMSELLHKDAMAIAILRGMMQKYPQHALSEQAQTYRAVLEKMQAASA